MLYLLLTFAVVGQDVSLYAPTPVDVVEAALEAVGTTKNDIVYDLGCGDGRVLIVASKKYGCRSVGIDSDPKCVDASKRNVEANGLSDLVMVYQGDITKTDFSQATIVFAYLMPNLLSKLESDLCKMKGSKLVLHDKPLPGVKSTQVVEFRSEISNRVHKLYVYELSKAVKCSGST